MCSTGASEILFFNKTGLEILEFSTEIAINPSALFSNSSPNSIQFFFYKKNVDIPIVIEEKNATEYVNINVDTYFIIHGWTQNGTLPWVKEAAERLNEVGNFNVIAVDWRILASGDYFSAVRNIRVVGYRIKDFLKAVNLDVNKVKIVGHSLGAQIASYVAVALGSEKISIIFGLDPAGPLFDSPIPLQRQYRLTSDDAKLVEVIHTMMGITGVTTACGTIDFYVNKGINQPGCLNSTVDQNGKNS